MSGDRKTPIGDPTAAIDIYTWKLLRRDRGLSDKQAKLAMCELLEPLMEPSR